MSPQNNNQITDNFVGFKTPVKELSYLNNIQGFIRTKIINPVVAPTFKPSIFFQQFEIRMDLKVAPTVKRLYIYSFETKIWSYITLT